MTESGCAYAPPSIANPGGPMQRSRRRRSRTRALVAALATTLAVTVLTLGAGPAAHAGPAAAEPNSPPVTVDDRLHMGVGWTYLASPLLNDTDPDGDKLDLCRLGRIPRNLEVRRSGNGLVIEARHQAANRTFSFTYYACDFEALVPGTITITIHERPGVRVTKVARPGVLRVHNPGRRTISFVYGGLGSNDPDGLLRVPRHASRTVRVHRHQLGWIAVNPKGHLIDRGTVRKIRLPRGGQRTAPAEQLGPRTLESWRSVSR